MVRSHRSCLTTGNWRPGSALTARARPRGVRRYGYYAAYYVRSLAGCRGPLLGGMKLTHHCNLTCRHCPFWSRNTASLSFEQAVAIIREFHRRGVRILILEGGEPLLWKDGMHGVDEVIEEAKKFFFCVGVTTNGTLPLPITPDVLWVSIDGLRDTHDAIRGKSYDRAMDNIQKSGHPKVFAHVTINQVNCREIPRLVEVLAPRVKGITIQFHYPYREPDNLVLNWEERGRVLDRLIDLKRGGMPVANSYRCLRALKTNSWTCRPWMIASADPTGQLMHGCYLKGRGPISCSQCGFSAHAELSLAYGGSLGAIRLASSIFGGGKAASRYDERSASGDL